VKCINGSRGEVLKERKPIIRDDDNGDNDDDDDEINCEKSIHLTIYKLHISVTYVKHDSSCMITPAINKS